MRRFNIPPSMQGYEVKDGRLINMAPSPEMGITKLAQMRASAKRYEKVQCFLLLFLKGFLQNLFPTCE